MLIHCRVVVVHPITTKDINPGFVIQSRLLIVSDDCGKRYCDEVPLHFSNGLQVVYVDSYTVWKDCVRSTGARKSGNILFCEQDSVILLNQSAESANGIGAYVS